MRLNSKAQWLRQSVPIWAVLPHAGGQGCRCATIHMKVLHDSGRCQRRRRPWVPFPSLEVSL